MAAARAPAARRRPAWRALLTAGVAGVLAAALPLGAGPGSSGVDRPAWAARDGEASEAGRSAERRRSAEERAAARPSPAAAADAAPARGPAAGRSGPTRGDPRFEAARLRYAEALGAAAPGLGAVPDKPALVLDGDAAAVLAGRGWRGVGRGADEPGRMVQRVRSFVRVARALGLHPSVGALQASFGSPGENGLAELQAAVEEARAALVARPGRPDSAAALHDRERELGAAVAALPRGPKGDWALLDLDANADGRIDRKDLDQARAERARDGAPAPAAPPEPAPPGGDRHAAAPSRAREG